MELYIIRHGQTYWNALGKVQGASNIELNDEGRRMAVETSKGMSHIHFDAVYSSPLIRAYETAEILSAGRNLPIIKDERIREMSFGCLEGSHMDEFAGHKEYPACGYFFTRPELYLPPPEGESFEEVYLRGKDFLEEIIEKHKDQDRVMIVAHGAMNRSLLRYFTGADIAHFWSGRAPKNCSAAIVEIKDGQMQVLEEEQVFWT